MPNEPPAINELTAILLRGHESKDFDYKSAMEWDEVDKKACCELVKDVLAMANTLGGFIAIGISEHPDKWSFDGVSTEQAKSFDTSRLNRFLQNYADPPINALLRKVNYDGKVFVMIEVSAFSDTPHICQREYPGVLSAPTLYVRTDNNESAPVRSSGDFKAVVERAVRNRGDSLLASFRSILTGGSITPEPSAREKFLTQRSEAVNRFEQINPLKHEEPLLGYLEASFMPERFDSSRFALEKLHEAAERAHVTYTGWPFLYIHPAQPERTYVIQDGWETLVQTKDFGGMYLMDFWRFQQSAFFIQRTTIRPSVRQGEQGTIPVADLNQIAIYVAEAIDCLTRLYDGLFDDNEYVSLELRLLNTEGRTLVNSGDRMPLWASYTCRMPEITTSRRFSLAEWRAAVIDHAVAITRDVYLRFNWQEPNVDLARNTIGRMFSRQW
jgi:hypothetical protein